MITDEQARRLREDLARGYGLGAAAARGAMTEKTARRWRRGPLPSQTKKPRTWRTRADPFEGVWAQVVEELELDDAVEAIDLFEELQEKHPSRFKEGQLRTLQRHVRHWRATAGPAKEVMFRQVHTPGYQAQCDFTWMNELGITIGGAPYPHKLFHYQLPYSGWEDVTRTLSETFEALSLGLQNAMWRLGGATEENRTDNLSPATHRLGEAEKKADEGKGTRAFTDRYLALLEHYRMVGSLITPGRAHENGVVEQGNGRFKTAVKRALRRRRSCDFATTEEYDAFLARIVEKRNRARSERVAEEREHLRPLPERRLEDWKEVKAVVGPGSLIRVDRNAYSVNSRLIGREVNVRVHAELLEIRLGHTLVDQVPRLQGRQQHRIDYRHVVHSLLRKPGAFARYQYRDELFPRLVFRKAYDALVASRGARADLEYLQVLHHAATTSECEVTAALELLLEEQRLPDLSGVKCVIAVEAPAIPEVHVPAPDLTSYDELVRRSA